MIRFLIVLLLASLLLTGCDAVDPKPDGSPGWLWTFLGTVADSVGIPGAGAGVGLLGWLWAHVRGRKYKRMATAGIRTVAEAARLLEAGQLTPAQFLEIARKHQANVNIHEDMTDVRHRMEAGKPAGFGFRIAP